MSIADYFPIYNKLSAADQAALSSVATLRSVPAGTILHRGSADCLGLLLIRSGQLRAYISSEEGKEITVYRLLEQDICLLSASCIMNSLQFEIMISAQKDTEFYLIPAEFYKGLMERSAEVANYTNQIMATRFTDVVWLLEQVMWKSMDKRLANFLLEESALENSMQLKLTHEVIAGHLGTAREVITRMLKYFQAEGMVKLTRGTIDLLDTEGLENLAQ